MTHPHPISRFVNHARESRLLRASDRLTWLFTFVVLVMLAGCVTTSDRSDGHVETADRGLEMAIDPLVLVRDAADQEGLYTLAGGLKPMSSGFWQTSIEIDAPDLRELEATRRALHVLRNDAWYADVQVFANGDDGRRWAQAFVVHRNALRRMIRRHAAFWNPWGITPSTHPAEIVAVVDRMPKADRWRGYGYLFGYPDEAVDFFVEAGLAGADGGEMGPGKDRRFIQIPTHAFETGRFTYAVPLDHIDTPADAMLTARAAAILAAYRERRGQPVDASELIEELERLNDRFEAAPDPAAENQVVPALP